MRQQTMKTLAISPLALSKPVISKQQHGITMVRFLCAVFAVWVFGVAPYAQSAITEEESAGMFEDALSRFNDGDYQGALIQLKNVLQHDSDDMAARLLLGRAYLHTGAAAAAEEEIKRAQLGGADRSNVLLPLGKAYFLQRKYDELLAEVLPGKYDLRINAQIYVLHGQAQNILRDFGAAEQSFERASELWPDHIPAILGRAQIRLAKGDLAGARQYAEEAISTAPGEDEPWFVQGEISRLERKFVKAIEQYSRAIELNPKHVKARVSRAASLLELDQTGEALTELEHVDSVVPVHFQAKYLRAIILARRGNHAEGRKILDNLALTLGRFEPKELMDDPADIFIAGTAKFARGDFERANEFLSLYSRLVPGDVSGQKILGATLSRLGHGASAMKYLQRAARATPHDPQVFALMGSTLMKMGEFSRASRMYQQAVDLDPEHSLTRSQLAMSKLMSGRESEAIEDLESVLTLDTAGPRAGLMLALLNIKRAEFDKGLAAAENLMERQQESPIPFNLAGASELGMGNLAAARARFEDALDIDSEFRPAINNLIELNRIEGKMEAATKMLETLLELNPKDIDTLMALSKIAETEGRLDDAIDWLEKIPGRSHVESNVQLVRLHLAAKDVEDAMDLARELASLHPDDPAVLEAKGRVELALSRTDAAVRSFQRIADVFTKSSPGLYRAAELQSLAGDVEGARASFMTATELDPSYLPAWVGMIKLDLDNGNTDSALETAYRLKQSDPTVGQELIGDILMRDEQFGLAAQAYHRGFIQEPTARLLMRLYGARRAEGNKESVVTMLESWMQANPNDLIVAQALATSYGDIGRTELAIQSFENLLEALPDSYAVNNNLALLYQRIGDKRALDLARRTYELAPDEANASDTFGWVLVQSGDVEGGVKYLREAHDRAPTEPEVRYHIGIALHRLGKTDAAREEFEKALDSGQSFDGDEDAKALLKALSSEK